MCVYFIVVVYKIHKCIIECTIIFVIKVALKYNRKIFLLRLHLNIQSFLYFSHCIANVSLSACFQIVTRPSEKTLF